MICDCCERSVELVSLYETDDDDCVSLCAACVLELTDMTDGSPMEGAFDADPT